MSTPIASPVVLSSLEDFQQQVPRDLQPFAKRIVVLDREQQETLYVTCLVQGKAYIVLVAGQLCPREVEDDFLYASSGCSQGKVEGYRWRIVTGGPPTDKLAWYVDRRVPIWDFA